MPELQMSSLLNRCGGTSDVFGIPPEKHATYQDSFGQNYEFDGQKWRPVFPDSAWQGSAWQGFSQAVLNDDPVPICPNQISQRKYPNHSAYSEPLAPYKNMTNYRLVSILVLDPDTNVPADAREIYVEPFRLTNLTDEEIWHEIHLQCLLEEHNEEVRTKTRDPKKHRASATETNGYKDTLDPIKISDLVRRIVTHATL